MYTIYADDKLLYSPRLFHEGCGVFSPKLTVELNKAGSLEFTMPPNNNQYDSVSKLKTILTVYENSNEIFRGRILHDERDFYKQKKVYSEGELAFLLDSIQRPYSLYGKPDVIFERLISRHNSRVEAEKQFTVGQVTLTFEKSALFSNTDYSTTFDELADKFVNAYGGFLRTRTENGVRYIDWLENENNTCNQTIEFGVNLLDLAEYITAEDIFTVIIPVGAEQYDEEGNSLGKLTLGSKDYIENETAISLFGRIEKKVEWSDIDNVLALISTANGYLKKNIEMAVSLTIKAIDLGLLNVNIEHIRVGDMVRVISLPHNINRLFQCTKIVYDLVNPDLTEYVFGVNFTALTEQQVSDKKVIQSSVAGVQSAIVAANTSATKANQAVEEVNTVVQQIPTTYVNNDNFNSLVMRVENLENGGGGGDGTSGENGVTFTPSVDTAGNLSWTNDGGLENPETVNIKGPAGDDYILTEADKQEIASLITVPSGGNISATHDGAGNVTLMTSLSVTHDGDGNVTIGG